MFNANSSKFLNSIRSMPATPGASASVAQAASPEPAPTGGGPTDYGVEQSGCSIFHNGKRAHMLLQVQRVGASYI